MYLEPMLTSGEDNGEEMNGRLRVRSTWEHGAFDVYEKHVAESERRTEKFISTVKSIQ